MKRDTDFTSAACPEFEALLEDYLAGDLGGADAKNVAEHVASCAGCRDAFAEAVASARLLRAAGPSVGPAPGFAGIVMARIYAAEQERTAERATFWQPFVSFGWRFAATAVLALAILITYEAGWGRRLQPNVAAVRPMNMTDIFSPDPARPPATRDEVLMMLAESNHGNN
jgi:anti-sigma factor RsiW